MATSGAFSYTGKNLQLVLMAIQPGETRNGERGPNDEPRPSYWSVSKPDRAKILIDGVHQPGRGPTWPMIVSQQVHGIMSGSTGSEPLRLYTLYAPPEHRDGTVHATKPMPTPPMNISTV